MINLSGQIFLYMEVNGTELAVSPSDLESCLITRNIWNFLPAFRIRVMDEVGQMMERLSLTDGSKVKILFGKSSSDIAQRPIEFRVTAIPKQVRIGQGTYYEIYGTLDHFRFLRNRLKKRAYRGTSAEVLAEVAEECGFDFSANTGTQDSMVWYPGRMSIGQFVNFVCDHGWASSKSCMMWAIDSDFTLHYVDISQLREQQTSEKHPILFYGGKPEVKEGRPMIPAHSLRRDVQSGMQNLMYGYNFKVEQDKLTGDRNMVEDVEITRDFSPRFEINEDAWKMMDDVATKYFGPDCGNGHEHFIEALHQNRRRKAVYSSVMYATINEYANLKLFDIVNPVSIDPANPLYKTDTRMYSDHIVTGVTQFARQTAYYEKYMLHTSGPANPSLAEGLL